MTDITDSTLENTSDSQRQGFYKKTFLAISAFLLFLMPILSFDAGITDDERLHCEHGVRLMNYYLGKDTVAAASPIDEHGEWKYKKNPYDYAVNINIYGGFFDMVCAFTYKYVTSHLMGEYESKHLMISISGVLLFILTGLIAFRLTGSWIAAILALLFACLSPRLFGHSFNNPKDIPFATTFAFGLYQIILLLQDKIRFKWGRAILLILAFIMAIDTRVGGLMLIFYMMSFAGLLVCYQVFIEKENLKKYILPFLALVIISFIGYIGASLFWPWASQNPVMNPLISLRIFSQFSQFNSMELFEGVRINNDSIPWYFVIKWFYISFPLFIVSGSILFLITGWWHIRDPFKRVLSVLLVAFSVFLPLILVMIQKSNIYDDARHLYFVMPSIVALCAVGWYWLFKMLPGTFKWPAIIVCFLTMLEPFLFMMRNHPHEVMYFSPAIGGVKGAFKNYEMDYWGFSLKAGLKWIDNTDSVLAKDRKTKVRLWYGEQLKVKYYADKSKHLEYALAPTSSPDWDYWLMLPAESKHAPGLLANWPPPNTIHQVMVDDVPLCAIVRNPLSTVSGAHPGDITAAIDPNDHMGRGMAFYNAKDYNKAIVEFKKLVAADSTNTLAYNNIVASYNLLNMYEDAWELGTKITKRYPDHQRLKNNLAITQKGLKEVKIDQKYYSGISYNYFAQGEYRKCIDASEKLLKYDPKSVVAYNNICASNNALGYFIAGKKAGLRALELSPNDQLIKNNIAVSEKGLREN